MNIAGTVILYHSGLSVISNIESYLPYLKMLIVFDNTETKDDLLHQQLNMLNNTIVIHDGVNKGIAIRLNDAAKISLSHNFDWLLTMDQDSSFTNDNIQQYFSCVQMNAEKEKVAMYGVNYETEEQTINCNCKQSTRLITSGSIVNLGLFTIAGGFDEALFIDDVDTDYCYNVIAKGYKIIKFENVFLKHQLGTRSYHTSFKTLKRTPRTLHSQERLYYMVRNYFYINWKYKNAFLEEKKVRKIDLINRLKNNFLYGRNRTQLIHNVILGWKDFKNNNLGKKN